MKDIKNTNKSKNMKILFYNIGYGTGLNGSWRQYLLKQWRYLWTPLFSMKKIRYIIQELFYLIKKEKLFFIMPIVMALALIAFLCYHIGPAIIVSFIYAGI